MITLEPVFSANIKAVYGEAGQTWIRQLPSLIQHLAKKWDFKFIRPIPNLTYSFVALVEMNSSATMAVLKTAPGTALPTEVHWLQCFSNCVPTIFEVEENNNVFLMEHLTPGESLKNLVLLNQDEAATRIICNTIRELQSSQQSNCEFKHLAELADDLSHLKGHVSNYTLSKVQSIFRDLTSDHSQDVILHGDLHHDNIINHHDSWKVIDPHGFKGNPIAEVGVMMRNPIDCFPKDRSLFSVIDSRLKILSEELPFDAQKIKAWAFCMTLLSAAWNIQDFKTETNFEFDIAEAIDKA